MQSLSELRPRNTGVRDRARIRRPVGLILCSRKDEAVAHYALDGLPNKVMAAEYRTTLPDEQLLASEIERATSSQALRERNREATRVQHEA